MISHPDRQKAVLLITNAIDLGAPKYKACKELGISCKTYNRWTSGNSVKKDGRPFAIRPAPKNKFSSEEKQCILKTCNSNKFSSLPPTQIVPQLADHGVYIGSESSIYRVLKEAGQQNHRGRARHAQKKPPESFCASGPCQVWSWDITWLP